MIRRGRRAGLAAAVMAAAAMAVLAAAPGRAAGPNIVVAIDPGHGGIDPGASSGGLVEKEVALDFARRLADRLSAEGMVPLLLRNDDSFLTLTDRLRLAHAGGANIIVSLHADTTRGGDAEGAHVYTLSRAGSDEAAEELALRENRAEILGGVALAGESDDLALLLVDLAQRGTGAESEKLAEATLAELEGSVPLLPTQPHRRANFRILKAADIPAILVELGYMSNAEDRARLVSDDWKDHMAAALARGIGRWARAASPGYLMPRR